MRWKLLALDLDGTTLNSNEEMNEADISAIREASRAGVRIIVTTGRSYASAYPYIVKLNTGDPTITYNGALIRNGRDVLRSLTLDEETIYRTLTVLKDLGQAPIVYSTDEKRHIDDPDSLVDNFFEFSKGSGVENVISDNLLDQQWEQIVRISVFTDQRTTEMLHSELTKRLGNSIKTVQTYFPHWNFWIFEILNPQCSKPVALQFLCDRYGFHPNEVVAVGDNRNDIEMLTWAGMGVAMRNSLPDVAQYADYITKRSNDEHGVAEVIHRYILSS